MSSCTIVIFWNGLKMRELQYYSDNEFLESSCLHIWNHLAFTTANRSEWIFFHVQQLAPYPKPTQSAFPWWDWQGWDVQYWLKFWLNLQLPDLIPRNRIHFLKYCQKVYLIKREKNQNYIYHCLKDYCNLNVTYWFNIMLHINYIHIQLIKRISNSENVKVVDNIYCFKNVLKGI